MKLAGVQSLQWVRDLPALVPRDALHPWKSAPCACVREALQHGKARWLQSTEHSSSLGSTWLERCWCLLFREGMLFCNYSRVMNADTVRDFKSNSHTLLLSVLAVFLHSFQPCKMLSAN